MRKNWRLELPFGSFQETSLARNQLKRQRIYLFREARKPFKKGFRESRRVKEVSVKVSGPSRKQRNLPRKFRGSRKAKRSFRQSFETFEKAKKPFARVSRVSKSQKKFPSKFRDLRKGKETFRESFAGLEELKEVSRQGFEISDT
jgi:hypothetical protein